jgi:hypothetical protein
MQDNSIHGVIDEMQRALGLLGSYYANEPYQTTQQHGEKQQTYVEKRWREA